MNIIEKEAQSFFRHGFLRSGRTNDLSNIKDLLTTKLYDFSRDRDQLDFLKTLRSLTIEDKENHKKSCSKTNCGYEEARDMATFAIDQEIDSIKSYYSYSAKSEDEFSVEEEAIIHNKLNQILEKLKQQGYGQQIIFDEIEELKNHFNLGKKNWFQMVKGKLFDLGATHVLEKTVINEVFSELSDGFDTILSLQ